VKPIVPPQVLLPSQEHLNDPDLALEIYGVHRVTEPSQGHLVELEDQALAETFHGKRKTVGECIAPKVRRSHATLFASQVRNVPIIRRSFTGCKCNLTRNYDPLPHEKLRVLRLGRHIRELSIKAIQGSSIHRPLGPRALPHKVPTADRGLAIKL